MYLTVSDLGGSVIRVDGKSMSPTLNPDDDGCADWILVEKLSYKWWHRFQRGEIAVLWAPDQPHQQIIKRVTALEHDVIWDDDAQTTVKIPKGRCWIEGDNPAFSGDSRTMYGPVHLGLLEGRAMAIVWPPWRIGWLPEEYDSSRVLYTQP